MTSGVILFACDKMVGTPSVLQEFEPYIRCPLSTYAQTASESFVKTELGLLYV